MILMNLNTNLFILKHHTPKYQCINCGMGIPVSHEKTAKYQFAGLK